MVRKIFHDNETGVQFEDDKGENYISLPVTGFDKGWRAIFSLYFSIENDIFFSYYSNYFSDYLCSWSKGDWVSSIKDIESEWLIS